MIDSITGLSVTVDAFDIDDFETAARTDQRTLLEVLLKQSHVGEPLVLGTYQRFEMFCRTDNSDGTSDGIETGLPDVFDRGARRAGIDTVEHLSIAMGSAVLPGGDHSLSTRDDDSNSVERESILESSLTDWRTTDSVFEASVSIQRSSGSDD